jgi:hypothetical protein
MRQKVVRNKPVKPLTRLQTEKMQEKKKTIQHLTPQEARGQTPGSSWGQHMSR